MHGLFIIFCAVDDFKPLTVDTSYSQPVLPKPHPIKASSSSFDLAVPESSLPKVAAVSTESNTLSFSNVTAAFRPFRSQLPVTSGEMVSRLLSQDVVPPPSGGSQSANCPTIVPRQSTSVMTSSHNVASLMLHPSVGSFQLVSAIPASHLAAGSVSRAPAPSVRYLLPQLALSDSSSIMQMLPTGIPVQSVSQSGTQQLAGFQLTALPTRGAIQLGSGQPVLMLCPQQSQAQHTPQQQQQQQVLQNTSRSSVLPVMVAADGSPQLASSK